MNIGGRALDHIVYCTNNFNESLNFFEQSLGVRPSIGGRHLKMGTKNAILNLGQASYLEILAVDENNDKHTGPHWMGIDLIKKPKITRWAIKSNNIQSDQEILKKHRPELATLFDGERLTKAGTILKWKMLLPQATPEVELVPFVLDWSSSEAHPTDKLIENCSIESIGFSEIEFEEKTNHCFQAMFEGIKISSSKRRQITAKIKGPKGFITI